MSARLLLFLEPTFHGFQNYLMKHMYAECQSQVHTILAQAIYYTLIKVLRIVKT